MPGSFCRLPVGGIEICTDRRKTEHIHYPNTDWWGATLRDYAPQQQHNLNIRGGNENVKCFVSGGYYHQDGMLKSDDIKNKRYNLRSNIDVKLSKKLDFGVDISIINQDYTGPRNQLERGSALGIMTMLYRARPYWSNLPAPDAGYVLTPPETSPAVLSEIDYAGYMKWTRLGG